MGLISTLSKVALGIVIAKGASHISRNGLPKIGGAGGSLGGLLEKFGGNSRADHNARAPHSNALGGLLTKVGGAGLGGTALAGMLGAPQTPPSAPAGSGPMFNQAIVGHEFPEPTRDQELAAALMLKAMVQAAMADGKLDEAESAKLMQHLGDATEDELAFVSGLMDQPIDITGLAADVPDGMEEQVYLVSAMAIDLDSRVEAQYLHDLATALGLSQPMVNDIHRQANIPLLYA
jgi:uncharacterized membrane protein YebE (DUF533 family)